MSIFRLFHISKMESSFYLKILYPYRLLISGLFIVAICLALSHSLTPYCLKRLLNSLPNGLSVFDFKNSMINSVFYLMASLFLVLAYRMHNSIWVRLSPVLKHRIHKICMHYVTAQPYEYFEDHPSAKTANAIREIAAAFPELIRGIFDGFLGGTFSLLFAMTAVSNVSYRFSFGLLCWIIVYVMGSIIIIKRTKSLAQKGVEARSKISVKLIEILLNIKCIRFFTKESYEKGKFKRLLDEFLLIDKDKERITVKTFAFQGFSFLLYQTICIIWLLSSMKQGVASAGDFALILTINTTFADYFRRVAKALIGYADQLGTIEQALKMLFEHAILDNFSRAVLNSQLPAITQGEIIFRNVHFFYKDHPPIFMGTNIEVKAGEKIAIIGESGGGKSTFINLIMRLYEINSGEIIIDQYNTKKMNLISLRSAINIIPQGLSLFSGTLMENILYGNQKATLKDAMLAAKKARIHDFIITLPEGYSTFIDISNLRLSMGQCQKISLARTFLKQSPILILDEALSHIDPASAKKIEQELLEFSDGKTTLFITHHLSDLIASAVDKIIFFSNGKIEDLSGKKVQS